MSIDDVERKILVIDDEEDLCSIIQDNLEAISNYKVLVAKSGEEGLKLAKEKKPDAILLDIHMPGMNGFDFLERVKSDTDLMHIPVLILSANADEQSKLEAARLGNCAYIQKPFLIEQIKEQIEKALRLMGLSDPA